MFMHAIAQRELRMNRNGVCTKALPWEKNPLPHRGIEPESILRLAFWSDTLPTNLSIHSAIQSITVNHSRPLVLHASPAAKNSSFLISAFLVHSTSFSHRKRGVP